MKNKLLLLVFSCILFSCSKDDGPILSSEKELISFAIEKDGNTYQGQIDHNSKLITIDIENLDLSSPLKPSIAIPSGAKIIPSPFTPQDFSKNIDYTITAENGDSKTYTVRTTSAKNDILNFSISFDNSTYTGDLDQINSKITLTTKGLEKHTSIVPSLSYSTNATITPDPLVAQNFNDQISYTLTAKDGTQKKYDIIVNNTPLSSEKKILQFDFNIDGETYSGVIDNTARTINIETNRSVTDIQPIITISEKATITPNTSSTQNFNNSIEYKITAEDGTDNTYTIHSNVFIINGTYNFSDQLYYKDAPVRVAGFGLDITVPNSTIVLENDQNSYTITPSNYSTSTYTQGEVFTSFSFTFPDNIVTATDYKLKYKIDNEVKVVSRFSYDVIADNIPVINSSNQTTYKYGDTLILYGTNLTPGLYVYANNGNIYAFGNNNYLSVNAAKTELTLQLTYSRQMFPSYYGTNDDYPTKLQILNNGRFGMIYTVDFD